MIEFYNYIDPTPLQISIIFPRNGKAKVLYPAIQLNSLRKRKAPHLLQRPKSTILLRNEYVSARVLYVNAWNA